jgi:tetratricopeptide (TPR) repeat protein
MVIDKLADSQKLYFRAEAQRRREKINLNSCLSGLSVSAGNNAFSRVRHKLDRLKNRIGFGIMAGLLLLLAGCATTTTVGSSAFMPEAEAMTEKRQSGGLERMALEELLAKGGLHLQAGNYQLAKLHYAMALKKNDKSAAAWAGLGEVFSAENNLKEAREAFDRAVAIDPRHRQALIASGRIRRSEDKHLEALDLFSRALAESPESPDILTEMAMTYDSLGQAEIAEPLYIRVTGLAPRASSSYNNLGFNYLLQQKYPEAVRTLELALSRDRNNRLARNNLATAYALNGQMEEAFPLLKRSVGEAGAYNNLGYFHMIRQEWEKAENAFRRAMELNPVYYARARENLDTLQKMRN